MRGTILDVIAGRATWEILAGDCAVRVREIPDASIDSIVADPPAGIGFMGKEWDTYGEISGGRIRSDDPNKNAKGILPHYGRGGTNADRMRHTDRSEVDFIATMTPIFAEGFRVLKPGGHCLLWALPRTSDWTMQALRRAGFEVRDVVTHLFGSGFPKSLDVSKAIDSAKGATREIVGSKVYGDGHVQNSAESIGFGGCDPAADTRPVTAPATPEARRWSGWGTSLKPANERWVMARKPIVELDDAATISARLKELEALVCSEIAKRAAQSSRPSRASSRKAKGASAPVPVATPREDGKQNGTTTGEEEGSSSGADTSTSGSPMAPMPTNIVSSWRRTWAAICERTSTSTTATASSLTTDLKTLNSYLSRITPESIILDASNPSGAPSHASDVGRLFDALRAACDAIQTSVAAEHASPSSCDARERRLPRVAPGMQPGISSEDWILARKPLSGTVAANVLAHGTGGLNIDGCRVGTGAPAPRVDRKTALGIMNDDGWQPKVTTSIGDPAGRFPANLVLSHAAWEETHCHCGASLPFVARFCPECGSGAVTHRRAGCCAVGERAERIPTFDASSTDRFIDRDEVSISRNGGFRETTVTAWECLATCACGFSTLAPSGGAAPRCRCGRAMAWGCPVARLDEQSGETETHGGGTMHGIGFGSTAQAARPGPEASSGGASRFFNCFAPPDDVEPFFWQAKPSAAETEAGCEHLPTKRAHENVDREEDSAGMKSPRAGAGRTSGRKNHHPTKKSIALMRHFVRLVTPPGGVVLDLFGGSGTTGCAAVLEGMRAILCEMEAEYVAIEEARIAFWERLAGTQVAAEGTPKPKRADADDRQGRLF